MSTLQKSKNLYQHLLWKLNQRQILGRYPSSFRGCQVVPSFSRLIERLVFQLDKVIPLSALEAGHILLGFSKCGQFLLTYTHSIELEGNLITVVHKYKLHWWNFVPYRKATKVTEVTLFSDQGVQLPLQIFLCYWPNDSTQLVVHGSSSTASDGESRECYLTITSVPSLNGCRDCSRIAQSYGDEDLAAGWDGCVRFSCLRHGWTLHSAYATVPPYPSFLSAVSLRRDGFLVVNAANFLHVLSAKLEFPSTASTTAGLDASMTLPHDEFQQQEWEDESLATPPSAWSATATPTRSSTLSTPTAMSPLYRKRCSPARGDSNDATCGGETNERAGSGINPAESEYDFMEDASEAAPRETISAFRKRRLADKKYEFRDENTENVPLKALRFRLRGSRSVGLGVEDPPPVVVSSAGSKESGPGCGASGVLGGGSGGGSGGGAGDDWEWNFSSHTNDVLRPFNSNIPGFTPLRSPLRSPEWDPSLYHQRLMAATTTPTAIVANGGMTKALMVPPQATPTCVVRFQRRYFEVDDELVSVITDIEDDDLSSSTGYHSALPIEVHGAGYAQMQMVSNVKALRLNMPHVSVRQMSIDTEQLCHEMAQRLCALSNKKYWFCTDFNVEIIDVGLETGDVIAVAFMLVEADVVDEDQIKRRLCQASAYFTWNIETGQHRIVDFDLPVDVDIGGATGNTIGAGHCGNTFPNRGNWHPARDVAVRLRKELLAHSPQVWTLSNKPELTGHSLSVIYDPSRTFAIVL